MEIWHLHAAGGGGRGGGSRFHMCLTLNWWHNLWHQLFGDQSFLLSPLVIFLAAGSYVALTVLGRPPGLPLQDEDEPEDTDVMEEGELNSPLPTSPALSARQQCSPDGTGLQHDRINYESTEGVRTTHLNLNLKKDSLSADFDNSFWTFFNC